MGVAQETWDGAGSSPELVQTLYGELRKIAHRESFRAGSPGTYHTTALVNEAYLKLRNHSEWEGRNHFLGCAATAMRHVLIDAARARNSAKRAGTKEELTDQALMAAFDGADDAEMARLGDAMAALQRRDPRLAKVVECRFFAGYDERETGLILGVTDRTVRRLWTHARAILYSEMDELQDA
jgi:RNA polymerase sigma factor (TIGR02999 family)